MPSQRKLISGRSQCWTSLLTYWLAQLRSSIKFFYGERDWSRQELWILTLEECWTRTVNNLKWQNDETKRQMDLSVPALQWWVEKIFWENLGEQNRPGGINTSIRQTWNTQVKKVSRLLEEQLGLQLELLSDNVQEMVDLGPMVKFSPKV